MGVKGGDSGSLWELNGERRQTDGSGLLGVRLSSNSGVGLPVAGEVVEGYRLALLKCCGVETRGVELQPGEQYEVGLDYGHGIIHTQCTLA